MSSYYNHILTALITIKYRLSSYDASYLELAIRKKAALGTLDGNLSKACTEAGLGTVLWNLLKP
jgi:predicted nucleic acid-binding protein